MYSRLAGVVVILLLTATQVVAAGVDNLKDGRGIIKDYTDMRPAGDIEWVWVAPDVKLSAYRFKVQPIENLTVIVDASMEETLDTGLPKSLERAGSRDEASPVLTVETAVYWAQRANRSKWFIPYAGLHLAQAGVGIELVFKNEEGEVVAKIRHSGREGDKLQDAAQELVDDVAQYVKAN